MRDVDPLQFRLQADDSQRFAELSGDFNPLHVDAIAARRSPFGNTIAHGVHVLLKSLDLCARHGLFRPGGIAALSATFSNPVLTGDDVSLDVMSGDGVLNIKGSSRGRKAFTLSLRQDEKPGPGELSLPESFSFRAEEPALVLASDAAASDSCALPFGRQQLTGLLPSLGSGRDCGWIADLLASTRVVGMRYPGIRSIFLGISLVRRTIATAASSLDYSPGPVDPRFGTARIAVQGTHFEGALEVMFRAPPVDQPSVRDIANHVGGTRFSADRVLVVGGSRGLGEIAAKCAMAAGAQVVITFASGAEDAQRICAEAREARLRCSAMELDVQRADSGVLSAGVDGAPFTHIYYFASPKIQRTSPLRWEPALFARFQTFYIDAFARLVEAACGGAPGARPSFLYPSTSFIDSNEKGFAEYVAAKSAGEALCRQLAVHRRVNILAPRLPRMLTDQTSGVADAGMADATTEIMNQLLRLHLAEAAR